MSHEVGHVWQFQNDGAGYISEALTSYAGSGDPYDWEAALDERLDFDDMTPDQQAEFARIIGIAVNTDPSGGITQTGLDVALGRTAGSDEIDFFQAILDRLLTGEA